MNRLATSTVWKMTPWQARVTWGNTRCSIGLCLEKYGGVVGHPQFGPQPVGQPLQVFLEQVLRGAVAPPAVAQDQQPPGVRVGRPAVLRPPQGDAVAAR